MPDPWTFPSVPVLRCLRHYTWKVHPRFRPGPLGEVRACFVTPHRWTQTNIDPGTGTHPRSRESRFAHHRTVGPCTLPGSTRAGRTLPPVIAAPCSMKEEHAQALPIQPTPQPAPALQWLPVPRYSFLTPQSRSLHQSPLPAPPLFLALPYPPAASPLPTLPQAPPSSRKDSTPLPFGSPHTDTPAHLRAGSSLASRRASPHSLFSVTIAAASPPLSPDLLQNPWCIYPTTVYYQRCKRVNSFLF